ncbi:MAG: putative cytochrome c [Candidatus Scalindua rubra]|uniref:Putative cytochrome c n=1 Tax=Candidatus Scalindua rubra TaxID=1872076 RepID=A0A1E3XGM2_9BACT|nr:MAG: putative cytochrome c [Candidatus Scalindua rubra]
MLILSSYIWLKDVVEPGWKKYQEEYYEQKRKGVEKELENAKGAEEIEKLKVKLAKLQKPKYEIKQILLLGEYSWANQRNGQKVDRCMTCHIDEGKLKASHNTVVKTFPFDIYGCSVCHGGSGRALDVEQAHHNIFKHKRDMRKRLENSDAIFAMWEEFATLSPEEEIEWGDFKNRTITGEKAIYMGSGRCLRCHTGLTAPHVERWKRVKFESFRVIQEAPDFIDGDENYRKTCYECHTTGYDKETGTYAEEGITCEACHGPGEVFGYFMDLGRALDGAKIARITPAYNVCGSNTGCHRSRRHEKRVKYFRENKELDPYEWFKPKYKRLVDEFLNESVEMNIINKLDVIKSHYKLKN